MTQNPTPGLLAIDAGTGSIRTTLFDAKGRIQRQARQGYRVNLAPGGCAEQDLGALWRAVVATLREIFSDGGVRVAGIGVTGALSLVIADSKGEPLRPALLWQDRRAVDEADAILRDVGADALFSTAGRRVDPEQNACKLLWMRKHEPEHWRRAATVYAIKDWIVQRLCGGRFTDRTTASYTLLFDVYRDQWNLDLAGTLAIPEALLPPVMTGQAQAGTVTREVASETGLPEGVPVVVGGPDGTLGALGSGMAAPGMAVNIIGTTDVFLACLDQPVRDSQRGTVLNAYVVPDRWAVGGPMGLTGGALRWFGETFLSPDNGSSSDPLFHVLDRLAAKADPGADGVFFLPGLSGDRVPRWNPSARGVVFGLSARHELRHVVRALFEGCAYTLADAVNAVSRLGIDIDEIRVAGGGAASDLWLRIRAGVLGRPLNVVRELEASSLGAAIAAGVGVGVYADFPTAVNEAVAVSHRIEPGSTLVETYQAHYEFYQQLYRQLEPAFADLAKLGRK